MSTWHAPAHLLERYARQPEALDGTTAASVEQHLVACADCRGAVAAAVEPAVLAGSWAAIVDRIDQPRRSPVEALLIRLRLPDEMARLVGATPGLQAAWLGVVLLAAVAATAMGRHEGAVGPFLALAPLVPVGAVALVFSPAADPAGEAGHATPMHGAGIALHRVVAVLIPTIVVLLALSLVQPHGRADAVAWVLPGLALAASSLVLATFVRVGVAAAAVALTWIVGLTLVVALDGRRLPLDETAAFDRTGQLGAVVVFLAAVAGIHARRDRFATSEVRW